MGQWICHLCMLDKVLLYFSLQVQNCVITMPATYQCTLLGFFKGTVHCAFMETFSYVKKNTLVSKSHIALSSKQSQKVMDET